MTLRFIIVLLLFLSFFKVSNAQTKADSLKLVWQNDKTIDSVRFEALNSYSLINMYSQPDSILVVTDYHYKLAQEKKSKHEMIWALSNKANIYSFQRKKFKEAILLFNQAEALAIGLNDTITTATIIGNKGNLFAIQQNYLEATQYFSAALKIFQKQKNNKGEGRMLNNLGGVYLTIGSYDLALEYYKKSLNLFNKRGIEDRKTALLFMNIGWIYYNQEKYNKAVASYKTALKIVKKSDDAYFVAACYSSLAQTSLKAGKIDIARDYAQKSLKINETLNDVIGLLELNLTRANITFETNIAKATAQAEAILATLPKNADNDVKTDLYQLLYKCYKAQNKLSLSLEMYELRSMYKDSVMLEKNNFAVAREAVKKDFELKLYQTNIENKAQQDVLKQNQFIKTTVIITTAVLLIALVLFYVRANNIKNRKEKNALLKALENAKKSGNTNLIINSNKFELNRDKIETSIGRKLNQTDWAVLSIILENPVITNKKIAEKAYMSVDGIGSSLRRMYDYFDVKDSKYKKIALLSDAIKKSNN